MTMSGDRTEPSAPLDLRTRGRERAGGGEADSTRLSPAVREDCTAQGVTEPNPAKGGGDQKPSAYQLPIRKRPLRSEADSRGSPTPAKVPRCDAARSGLNVKPLIDHDTTSQGARALSRSQPDRSAPVCYCPYTQTHLYQKFLTEDTHRLLTEVALATRQDEDGDTALHIAVVQGNEVVVHRLIHILRRAQKDLDLYNNLRQTPLHLAVITHQPAIVEALLQNAADPGALDRNGQNALHLCCEHNQDRCLSVILFHLAHSSCCPSACLDSRNYEGITPLHLAVQNGNKKLAKMLLEGGADINAVDIKSGRCPLIHAVENNCMDMVNFLIENGCNVNAQSYSGNTALHSACGRGEVEAVRVLLKNGADSSLKNYHNDTAVMVAKNKKVSDVLRGKTTRGHTLKTQHSFNGTPSPNSLSHSPLATPNLHRSTSLSPVAPRTHSPHSQSGESMSGNLSPVDNRESEDLQRRTCHDNRDYGVSVHSFPFFSQPRYEPLLPPVNVLPGHPAYYPGTVPRHVYPDQQFIILPAGIGTFVPHNLPPTSIAAQSRPSSHNSDQSDMSNLSVSSEGKGVS